MGLVELFSLNRNEHLWSTDWSIAYGPVKATEILSGFTGSAYTGWLWVIKNIKSVRHENDPALDKDGITLRHEPEPEPARISRRIFLVSST